MLGLTKRGKLLFAWGARGEGATRWERFELEEVRSRGKRKTISEGLWTCMDWSRKCVNRGGATLATGSGQAPGDSVPWAQRNSGCGVLGTT